MRLGTRLALTMLLGGLAVLAPRPASAYLWQSNTQVDPPMTSLQVSDVLLGSGVGVVRVQWDYTSLAGSSGAPTFDVERSSGGAWSSLGTTTNRFVLSNTDWNTSYQYRVRVDFDESGPDAMLPPPGPCANPEDIYFRDYVQHGQWRTINVTPVKVTASDNQTADSRWDLRYGNPTPLDFAFGNRIYRGGLFAGYANDPSRVARSYMKFPVPLLSSGQYVWAASIWLYHTRLASPGSVTLGAHLISDSWTQAALKWSTGRPSAAHP